LEKTGYKSYGGYGRELLEIIKTFNQALELKYNKFYISLAANGQPNNFAIFRPQKNGLRLEIKLKKSEELEEKLNEAGLDIMDYDNRWGKYRIRLTKQDIKKHEDFLKNLLKEAYTISG
jgi:predicted transport protein